MWEKMTKEDKQEKEAGQKREDTREGCEGGLDFYTLHEAFFKLQ